jgi:hypothetical protein
MWALPGVTRASPSPKKRGVEAMQIVINLNIEQLAIATMFLLSLR